jgi:hypothetical protein
MRNFKFKHNEMNIEEQLGEQLHVEYTSLRNISKIILDRDGNLLVSETISRYDTLGT